MPPNLARLFHISPTLCTNFIAPKRSAPFLFHAACLVKIHRCKSNLNEQQSLSSVACGSNTGSVCIREISGQIYTTG